MRALLALVLLQHARRGARLRDGRLVGLADQDRGQWDHDQIRVGLASVAALEPGEGYAEELRLQALIAAEHARAPTAEATAWVTIADLYADLEARTGSPVVRLNRAVAVAEAHGPEAGLVLLQGLDEMLGESHRLASVRGELAHRAGDHVLAASSYRAALDRCANEVEREHLRSRLEALGQAGAC